MEDIEARIVTLEVAHNKDIAYIKREFALQLASNDKALELQAAEISRRLNELNGEAERLKEMQGSYLPREKFDDFERRTEIELKGVVALKGQIKGTIVMIAAIVSMITTLLIPLLGNLINK